MTIRIIDLLVKIANGEEVPKKIWFKNNFYEYDGENQNYVRSINFTVDFLIGEDITALLNDEVEIIEENKKIEKLEIKDIYMCDDYGHIYINFKNTWNKINEIIDAINELKKGD